MFPTVGDALFISAVEDDVFNGVEEIVQRNQENAKKDSASMERQKKLGFIGSNRRRSSTSLMPHII